MREFLAHVLNRSASFATSCMRRRRQSVPHAIKIAFALGVQLSPSYEKRGKLCVFDLTAMICKKAKRRLAPTMRTDE